VKERSHWQVEVVTLAVQKEAFATSWCVELEILKLFAGKLGQWYGCSRQWRT